MTEKVLKVVPLSELQHDELNEKVKLIGAIRGVLKYLSDEHAVLNGELGRELKGIANLSPVGPPFGVEYHVDWEEHAVVAALPPDIAWQGPRRKTRKGKGK